jgi:NAD(P)-dependent dehydrogenase (short-subunit alcohol dehydrogenase family)
MMAEISMDGRVAVVTGAGRALGRAYALLLAERGAKVLVNDLGTEIDGRGKNTAVAEDVVEEIRAAGGMAVADASDVSDPAGGAALIDNALNAFGRIDAVIANAGIHATAPFEDTRLEDFVHQWRIHCGGTITVAQAAWPHFKAQRYGRLVTTGSGGGIFGLAGQASYAAAKGAIQALTRVLALEGDEHGIRVNMVAPGAFSRMAAPSLTDPATLERSRNFLPPELVAPLVLWLASERCSVTGQAFTAWGGRIARLAAGAGRGLIDRGLTPEMVDARFAEIASLEDFHEPVDVLAELDRWVPEIH